ncbi:hypothetical protein [Halorubrum sp. SY-15]|uniref:hypothetical protein n=1 Tax=Halorubrum sp. SY-15 TaxID=3402277 RepID=UPI003EB8A939
MIGLGALGVGSGATALTGATIQNSIAPTADFRIGVPDDTPADALLIERGQGFDTEPSGASGAYTASAPDDTFYDKTESAVAADDNTNGDLKLGLVIPFDQIPDSGENTLTLDFPQFLKITNNSGSEQKIIIQYAEEINVSGTGFGTVPNNLADEKIGYANTSSKAGTGKPFVSDEYGGLTSDGIDFDAAADVVSFEIENTNDNDKKRISPASGAAGQASSFSARTGGGVAFDVDLKIEIDNSVGEKIHSFVEGIEAGSFKILNKIFVGTTDGTEVSSVGVPPEPIS